MRCRVVLILLMLIAGCAKPAAPAPALRTQPKVRIVKPQTRTIERTVGQPGVIDAYEQTSIYAKVAGFVQKWLVDIGDPIKKDQLMVQLFVPELDAEYQQKKAQAELDEVQIKVAQQLVDVAEGTWKSAVAHVGETKANLGKFQAEIDRWQSEVKRLTSLVEQRVVDRQVLDESIKQLKSNTASRDAAQSTILSAEANEVARRADVAKSKVDVAAAQAKAKVSQADVQRLAALVSYTKITAPYDGVVTVRNANTGDFVQPSTGDLSAGRSTPDQSAGRGTPVYVVARTDKVRVYVDVPEMEADLVRKGTRAQVRVQALNQAVIDASVTRTSWALNVKSRTLRSEIDLPNPDARLLPGMYAYGMVMIERPKVLAAPAAAIVELGNQNCCYLLENGKAVKTPLQTGLSDSSWTEVVAKQVQGAWTKLTGSEELILGDLSEISNGQAVTVEQ